MSKGPATILIVDDNEVNRYAMGRILKEAGYNIWEAATRKEGLEYAAKKPDIVILDVVLPDGNGFEICQELKNSPDTKLMTVLMVSAAFVGSEDKAQGLDSGADGYLITPIHPVELVATIKSLLRIREAEKELSQAQDILLDRNERLGVLYEATAHLLLTDDNDQLIKDLFKKASKHLEIDIYLNYLVTEKGDGLFLDSYTGISAEDAESIHDIQFGEGETGKVALYKITRVLACVQESSNEDVQFFKQLGIRAMISIPLMVGTKLLGTLAFATCRIDSFSALDIELLKIIAHYVAIAKNRLYTENELRDARDKAESASIAKSSFLANMSHEIRTPISTVIAGTELLLHSHLTREQRDFAEAINRGGEILLSLINDILDFSKIEAGSMVLNSSPFRISMLSDEIAQLFSITTKDSNVLLIMQGFDSIPYVMQGDYKRLRQIMFNLVGNAIKFSKDGEVVVSATKLIEDNNNVTIRIEVQDTGIGIAKEKLETIFDKFMQADSSTNKKFGGTGLGLAISKQLTELMGGTINVTSEQGKGSCFWIEIPFKRSHDLDEFTHLNASLALGKDLQLANARPMKMVSAKFSAKILLVDDYLPNQKVGRKMLEKMGCDVDVAADGSEAIEMLKTSSYDLVFMDCQMPEMDGFEATRLIRQNSALSKNTIIAMTANVLEGDREKCFAAGMDDYIAKPIRYAELDQILLQYLQYA